MKQVLKPMLYVAAVLCMSVSCKTDDRTTIVFGTVKDDLGKPVAGVEMNLYGEKGILGSRATLLKTTKTDTKGEYNITTYISKDYHSGDFDFRFDTQLYSDFKTLFYFNGNKTTGCCEVKIGQKNQHDLVLFRK